MKMQLTLFKKIM